jgi:hypothetical protein
MSKQIIHSNGNIVEKVLRDKEGKLIRARFFVYENGGRIKARLLDFVYLTEQILLKGKELLLSIVSKTSTTVSNFFVLKVVTRNYKLATVYAIGSKPRGPNKI